MKKTEASDLTQLAGRRGRGEAASVERTRAEGTRLGKPESLTKAMLEEKVHIEEEMPAGLVVPSTGDGRKKCQSTYQLINEPINEAGQWFNLDLFVAYNKVHLTHSLYTLIFLVFLTIN